MAAEVCRFDWPLFPEFSENCQGVEKPWVSLLTDPPCQVHSVHKLHASLLLHLPARWDTVLSSSPGASRTPGTEERCPLSLPHLKHRPSPTHCLILLSKAEKLQWFPKLSLVAGTKHLKNAQLHSVYLALCSGSPWLTTSLAPGYRLASFLRAELWPWLCLCFQVPHSPSLRTSRGGRQNHLGAKENLPSDVCPTSVFSGKRTL